VVYRETICKTVTRHEVFEVETEGKAQKGEVRFTLAPLKRGSGVLIQIPEGDDRVALPEELRQALRDSLEMSCRAGIRTGYPLVDIEITVLEAPFVSGATTEMGVRAAAQRGFSLAAAEASPTLLEPVMALEITSPSEFSGKVLASLQQKGGRIEGMESRGEMETIRAEVPLSQMFGYMTELRSATKGRGTFTMEFSHFSQAPKEDLERYGF